MARRAQLLGLPVDRIGTAEVLECLVEWINSARATSAARQPLQTEGVSSGTRHVVTLNPEIVMAARHDAALRRAIRTADLVLPDGIGVVWALRLRGEAVLGRVTGIDLLDAFAGVAAARGYRVFLLGAAPGVAQAAASRLIERYPGLTVVGGYAGSPDADDAPGIIERIKNSRADAVFVAFGAPAQERWIASHREQLGAAVAMGVGGAFDFLAGDIPRAPRWMRRYGLEWLYRLAREPWRWRRMLALPCFVVAALRETRHSRITTRGKLPLNAPDISATGQQGLGAAILMPTEATRPTPVRPHAVRHERLLALVSGFAGRRVLVVGDMVADEYIIGTPTRISREAPVLILEHQDQYTVPGGATNPGVNARALGADVFLAGVIGDDLSGAHLRRELEGHHIHMDGLFSEPGRPTTTKTRILAGGTQLVQQQIVRVDRIYRSDLGDNCVRDIIEYVRRLIPTVDALILSDYENGVINPEIIEASLPLAIEHGKIVTVDSHGDLARFQGATALTPNQPEAEATLGMRITDRASLESAGARLLDETNARGVLITRGSEGMSLFEHGQPPLHIPASNLSRVFDPTGAGDTVAATFTLALVTGASMAEAATLANIAAGLVVRRTGCATTTPDELSAAINSLVDA
ncbi:MAG TPA: PfkB family carbohydrate kinase [Ktedonobacterales bacterium]|nr:PfkB family carbohydrate kinase [Ktedonobacterales bacterium]